LQIYQLINSYKTENDNPTGEATPFHTIYYLIRSDYKKRVKFVDKPIIFIFTIIFMHLSIYIMYGTKSCCKCKCHIRFQFFLLECHAVLL